MKNKNLVFRPFSTGLKGLMTSMLMLISAMSYTQVVDYNFSQAAGTYTPISGTVLASHTGFALGVNSMDDVIYNIPNGTIPFTFVFDGNGYTGLNVSSNGFLTFGATAPTAGTYAPISTTTAYAGAISPFGRDLQGGFAFNADSGNATKKWTLS